MNDNQMMDIFKEYEEKFGVWLYSAWDFESVDWYGLAKEANKCIRNKKPMDDKTKNKYFEPLEEGKIY